jgi:hypothetical protein
MSYYCINNELVTVTTTTQQYWATIILIVVVVVVIAAGVKVMDGNMTLPWPFSLPGRVIEIVINGL